MECIKVLHRYGCISEGHSADVLLVASESWRGTFDARVAPSVHALRPRERGFIQRSAAADWLLTCAPSLETSQSVSWSRRHHPHQEATKQPLPSFFLFCLCVWYLTLDILSCFSGCSTGTSVWGPSPSPLRSVVRTRAWKFDHLCSQSKAFLLMFHHRTSPTHLPRRWFPADFFFGLRLCAELRGPLADRALRKGDNGVLVRGRRFSVSRKSCSSFPPVRYTHRPGLLPSLGLQPHGRLQLNSGQDPKSGKSSSDNTTSSS